MASNIESSKKGYELFGRGEIDTFINELIDEDCRWLIPGPEGKLPWAGTYKGKKGVAEFFTTLAQTVEFTDFVPHDMIEKGNTVITLGTFAGHIRATGKRVDSDWVHVAKYSDAGKLVFFQDYVDTAKVLLAMS